MALEECIFQKETFAWLFRKIRFNLFLQLKTSDITLTLLVAPPYCTVNEKKNVSALAIFLLRITFEWTYLSTFCVKLKRT